MRKMLPKRAVVRTLTPQEEEVNVNVIGSIRGVAAAKHQPEWVVPRKDGSSIMEMFLRFHLPIFKGEEDP